MGDYTQQGRLVAIFTPLGEDVLLLQRLAGQESISGLFRFDLELLSENSAISFSDIVGQPATIALDAGDAGTRYFNGHLSRFAQSGRDDRFTHYRAELVPWLWFLTRTADCRIFQKMAVPDIIVKVFQGLGFKNFKNSLQSSYSPREYCVQYRETDFNFVSRLMEESGIFYFFEHDKDKHTLVLGDSPAVHKDCPGISKVVYDTSAGSQHELDTITEWYVEQEFRPGQYTLNDYNYETPATSLMANVNGIAGPGSLPKYEIYDYPGAYTAKADGDKLAKLRMQEEEAPCLVTHGAGTCRALAAGFRFSLADHYRRDLNKAYVLTRVQHYASVGSFYAGGQSAPESYSNEIVCIPQDVAFRPPRQIPKPVVQGPQTAVVVGPAGEEIYTDKYGRVKVQFHWDREGKYDENSSCWIRVSQLMAGKKWGAMWLPRVDQEVIIEFLEGDPDQPIVTGRVYNAVQTVPYGLPDEKTKSTIKSLSSKGGGGFNEIRFEDAKGSEQIFIHAEKNQDIRIKNDLYETIGGESHLIVEKDQLEAVKGDKHQKVTGDHNISVGGTVSLKAGSDLEQKVGANCALEAGTEIHLKAGMNLVIEAGTTLTLSVGGNFINLNPAGVFISGTMVMINSGGSAGSGAAASPQDPKPPKEADKADPGDLGEAPPPKTRPTVAAYSPAAIVLQQAAQTGAPFCEH
jgi:type VI secretion system secreted protein VgrG